MPREGGERALKITLVKYHDHCLAGFVPQILMVTFIGTKENHCREKLIIRVNKGDEL